MQWCVFNLYLHHAQKGQFGMIIRISLNTHKNCSMCEFVYNLIYNIVVIVYMYIAWNLDSIITLENANYFIRSGLGFFATRAIYHQNMKAKILGTFEEATNTAQQTYSSWDIYPMYIYLFTLFTHLSHNFFLHILTFNHPPPPRLWDEVKKPRPV